MKSRIIVLTGIYKVVGALIAADSAAFGKIAYFPCISDSLKEHDQLGHWRTCPFFDDLVMQREIARDSTVLSTLKGSSSIGFIEQWHIGNVASAKGRSPEIEIGYAKRLRGLLGSFEGINIETWYVSTDLEKGISADYRKWYQIYLKELSTIIKDLELVDETLDGDAPIDVLRKRILHLLYKSDRS